MMSRDDDRKAFVREILAEAVRDAISQYPPDMAAFGTLADRLDTFAFGLWPRLAGAGNMDAVRLSPAGQPGIDLVGGGAHELWSAGPAWAPDAADPAQVALAAFFHQVRRKLGMHIGIAVASGNGGTPAEKIERIGRFAEDVLTIIDDQDYELVVVHYDRFADDEPWEGDNIAPGLAATFRAALADRIDEARKVNV